MPSYSSFIPHSSLIPSAFIVIRPIKRPLIHFGGAQLRGHPFPVGEPDAIDLCSWRVRFVIGCETVVQDQTPVVNVGIDLRLMFAFIAEVTSQRLRQQNMYFVFEEQVSFHSQAMYKQKTGQLTCRQDDMGNMLPLT